MLNSTHTNTPTLATVRSEWASISTGFTMRKAICNTYPMHAHSCSSSLFPYPHTIIHIVSIWPLSTYYKVYTVISVPLFLVSTNKLQVFVSIVRSKSSTQIKTWSSRHCSKAQHSTKRALAARITNKSFTVDDRARPPIVYTWVIHLLYQLCLQKSQGCTRRPRRHAGPGPRRLRWPHRKRLRVRWRARAAHVLIYILWMHAHSYSSLFRYHHTLISSYHHTIIPS